MVAYQNLSYGQIWTFSFSSVYSFVCRLHQNSCWATLWLSTEENHINTSVKKGGIAGVSCWLEHMGVVRQLTREAREGRGDTTMMWLDLANIYGRLPITKKKIQWRAWKRSLTVTWRTRITSRLPVPNRLVEGCRQMWSPWNFKAWIY